MSKVIRGLRLTVFLLAAVLVVPLAAQPAYASDSAGIAKTAINKQVVKAEDPSPASGSTQKPADEVNGEEQSENSQPSVNAELPELLRATLFQRILTMNRYQLAALK